MQQCASHNTTLGWLHIRRPTDTTREKHQVRPHIRLQRKQSEVVSGDKVESVCPTSVNINYGSKTLDLTIGNAFKYY